MRLSFGAGIVFLPFALVASAQHVIAKSYGEHLSDVVASVIGPFVSTSSFPTLAEPEAPPLPALRVAEESDVDDFEPNVIAAPTAGRRQSKVPAKSNAKDSAAASAAKGLPAIYVAAQTVLRIANSGARPSGRSVIAEGRRPAGVQVFGASALGIGVRDGDVITKVNGVPVASANQVVALVIAARGARQATISAQVYRGQRSYVLTVEQPYVSSVVEAPRSELDADSSSAGLR